MYKIFPILLFAYGLAVTTEDIYDNSHALIIGIDKYKNKSLDYAVKDAESVAKLLRENLEVTINFFEDKPLSVELPISIECKVTSTDASLKGQTVSSSYKPAIIDNNLKIMVPPFIETDDEIIVDSRSLEYIKKIK